MTADAQRPGVPVHPEIYEALAEYQEAEAWDMQDLARDLHRWADRFNIEFLLDVPAVALCVDDLARSRYGHFRYGHNGFGLVGEVAINRRYVQAREYWQVLGTLLHELLHAWQQAHGHPGRARNYHNLEFRQKAADFGLVVDSQGHTSYAPDSPFLKLLATYGVQVPGLPAPITRLPGRSKLKKWTCGCTNVRVAVADFRAQCLHCGNVFVRA